ncbi:hypothetical protein AAVH_03614 [Aphelenchoides avenae]|nr:hypothetical protein AAVH_03614 [Aphelenchus avenae]
MRSAGWVRLGLKVYAVVFIVGLVYLNVKPFLEDHWLLKDLHSNPLYSSAFWRFVLHVFIFAIPFFALLLIAIQLEARFEDVEEYADYKLVWWLVFVASAAQLLRLLAQLLISWWQLLVDVFDSDRWWDAASKAAVFFGSFFAYCVFIVALDSLDLEVVETRELAQLRQERRQVDAAQNVA